MSTCMERRHFITHCALRWQTGSVGVVQQGQAWRALGSPGLDLRHRQPEVALVWQICPAPQNSARPRRISIVIPTHLFSCVFKTPSSGWSGDQGASAARWEERWQGVMSTAGGRIAAGVGANLIGIHATDRNQEATVYVGNIDVQATEELLWQLFVQAGPVGEGGRGVLGGSWLRAGPPCPAAVRMRCPGSSVCTVAVRCSRRTPQPRTRLGGEEGLCSQRGRTCVDWSAVGEERPACAPPSPLTHMQQALHSPVPGPPTGGPPSPPPPPMALPPRPSPPKKRPLPRTHPAQ